MENFIDQLEIRNFKSIRELKLDGFNQINLFIGRPNVGKSNLLEALSIFSLSYIWEERILTDIIRLENQRECFYDGDVSEEIMISFRNKGDSQRVCNIAFNRGSLELNVKISDQKLHAKSPSMKGKSSFLIDTEFHVENASKVTDISSKDFIKKYVFNPHTEFDETDYGFLQPPFGNNLLYVLELMPDLRKLYARWFRQYGLRLVLDATSQSLKIQKEKGDEVFQFPYSSVADTLQRIIFYKTAVASNENSVLLFEEPEAHAYPPYISEFTQEVIKSTTNQFFIVTHSPLIVADFLEGAIDDLGIFMVDFKDGQTVVRSLSKKEIQEVHQYGVDLFFNNEAYLA